MARFSSPHLVLVLAGLAVQAGCAVSRPTSRLPEAAGRSTVISASNVLHWEELSGIPASTAYEAVSRLRPRFLRAHGIGRGARPDGGFAIVYLDGVRLGDVDILHSIRADEISEIRFLGPVEAAGSFINTDGAAVIEIRTRRE